MPQITPNTQIVRWITIPDAIVHALRERAPKTHRRTVEHLDSLIHDNAMLDVVGEIELWP